MADIQHERDCQEVIRVIGGSGGKIGRRDLFHRLKRMNKRTLEGALPALTEAVLSRPSRSTQPADSPRRFTCWPDRSVPRPPPRGTHCRSRRAIPP